MHQPDYNAVPFYNPMLVYPGGSKVIHNDVLYMLPERTVIHSFGTAVVVPLTAYPGHEPGVSALWLKMKQSA